MKGAHRGRAQRRLPHQAICAARPACLPRHLGNREDRHRRRQLDGDFAAGRAASLAGRLGGADRLRGGGRRRGGCGEWAGGRGQAGGCTLHRPKLKYPSISLRAGSWDGLEVQEETTRWARAGEQGVVELAADSPLRDERAGPLPALRSPAACPSQADAFQLCKRQKKFDVVPRRRCTRQHRLLRSRHRCLRLVRTRAARESGCGVSFPTWLIDQCRPWRASVAATLRLCCSAV